jgi:hypothetical protein
MGNRYNKLESEYLANRNSLRKPDQNRQSHLDPSLEQEKHSFQDRRHDDELLLSLIHKAFDDIHGQDYELARVEFRSTPVASESNESIQVYKPEKLSLFLDQDIDQIRQTTSGIFKDPKFSSNIRCITRSASEKVAEDLFAKFAVQNKFNLNELNEKLIWRNSQVSFT